MAPKIIPNPCEFSNYDSSLKKFLCQVRVDAMARVPEGVRNLLVPCCGFNPPYEGYTHCSDRRDRLSSQTRPNVTEKDAEGGYFDWEAQEKGF